MNKMVKWLGAYLEDILFLIGLVLISIAAFTISYFVGLVVTGGELLVTAWIIAEGKKVPLGLAAKEEVSD